jgi:FtsP/CotA-like multicopper oxidase with cupredoxin domain
LSRHLFRNLIVIAACCAPVSAAWAQACPQLRPGATAREPASISSTNGVLRADFSFRTSVDEYGLRHYCYVYGANTISPTLRVHPGDELVLRLRNELPADGNLSAPSELPWPHAHTMTIQGACGGGKLYASSTNLHFHGVSIAPSCHADDVISTLVEPGAGANGGWYEYRFRIPRDQSPGLYWYHPHPHGFSEAQVLGGASGALIVEGVERVNPRVADAFERLIVLRDQILPGTDEVGEDAGPARDVTVNGVPVMFPMNRAVSLEAQAGRREFWRVLNAAADTYFDLQLRTAREAKDAPEAAVFEIVALDGAPAEAEKVTHVLIPPGGRAEFLVTMPRGKAFAQLVTLRYDTGPAGESTPERVLANVDWRGNAVDAGREAAVSRQAMGGGVRGLEALKPARTRKLYFSERHQDPNDYASTAEYFITIDGETPRAFDMHSMRPNVVARQGTVEDWLIENRAPEAHNFHIHQLHFQVLERDGRQVREEALRDTIDLPFWDGKSAYPSVKLRMDFRGAEVVGLFPYHCHILEHEDGGMMGLIQVLPALKR